MREKQFFVTLAPKTLTSKEKIDAGKATKIIVGVQYGGTSQRMGGDEGAVRKASQVPWSRTISAVAKNPGRIIFGPNRYF